MNRLLLDELQRRRAYPSVTLLLNTTEGRALGTVEHAAIERMLADLGERLAVDPDVDAAMRSRILDAVVELVVECHRDPATAAMALCVSPDYRASVRLGTPVRERVVVDDTFARAPALDAVRRMLDTARTLIVKEIAIARGQTEDQVKNEIEVLPVSMNDDQLRLALYQSIYGHSALETLAVRARLMHGTVVLDPAR